MTVNEVTTRGRKSTFGQGCFRCGDWDKGRDHEKDDDHNRNKHWDRYSDSSRGYTPSRDHEKDKKRGYEYAYYHDPSRDHFSDRDQDIDLEDHELGDASYHDQECERNSEFDRKRDREIDEANDYHRSFDKGKKYSSRKHNV